MRTYSNEYIHNKTGFSDSIFLGIVLMGQKQQWNATLASSSFSILLADDNDESNKIFTISCDKKQRNKGLYKISEMHIQEMLTSSKMVVYLIELLRVSRGLRTKDCYIFIAKHIP